MSQGGSSPAQVLLNKRYQAQVESSLASAAIAQESYIAQPRDSYTDDVAQLLERGFQARPAVSIDVLSAGTSSYCIQATHRNLPTDHPFKVASYDSEVGRPVAEDDCHVYD